MDLKVRRKVEEKYVINVTALLPICPVMNLS